MPDTFGRWLYERRFEAGLTLRELARRARLSHGYVSRLELDSEPAPPSEAAIRRLAEALETQPFEACRRAGRIPRQLEAQLLEDPAWFDVLLVCRFQKVPASRLLELVAEESPEGRQIVAEKPPPS